MENRIKEVIKGRGYKVQHIADKVGVSSTEMSNYIANRRKPNNDRVLKLAIIKLKILNIVKRKIDSLLLLVRLNQKQQMSKREKNIMKIKEFGMLGGKEPKK